MANMAGIGKFIKDWMLPLAIILGITSYLILFFVNPLARSIEPGFSRFAKDVQPVFMATMLFLQFNTISPHDLRFRKWHFLVLAFQIATFVPLTWLVATMPDGDLRILAECAMLCLICPTAICARVFPLLVLPLLLAWFIRYTMRRLQRWLMRFTDWAFYCWGIALTFSIYLATRSLMNSGISIWTAIMIGVISLICTILQFAVGRLAGRKANESKDHKVTRPDEITAGQALGQKNSGGGSTITQQLAKQLYSPESNGLMQRAMQKSIASCSLPTMQKSPE